MRCLFQNTRDLTARLLAILVIFSLTAGCTRLIVDPLIDPLVLSLQKQTDLDLLRDGAPSLLLIIDGLIASDPENAQLLMAGTKAYSSYAAALFEYDETARAAALSLKARNYGITLLRLLPDLAIQDGATLTDFTRSLEGLKKKHVPDLFWGGYGWATWIRFQDGAPAAMAALPMVEQVMLRVVALDETFYYGGAHLFLGAYYGSRPKMYGGKPEESRKHFERALEIGQRKLLLTQVAYAEGYARMIFDRELYESLLTEVLAQPLENNELASSNQLAKQMAAKLLAQIDDFF